MIAKIAVAAARSPIDKAFDYAVPEKWADGICVGQRVMVPFGAGNRKTEGIVFELLKPEEERPLKPIAHIFHDECTLSYEQLSLALWMRKRYFCTAFEAANAQLPPGIWNKHREVLSPGGMTREEALSAAGKSAKKHAIVEAVYDAAEPLTEAELEKAVGQGELKRMVAQLVKQGVILFSQQFEKKLGDKTIVTARLAIPIEQARVRVGRGKLAEKRLSVLECLAQAEMLPEAELCYLTGVSSSAVRTLERMGLLMLERTEVYRRPHIPRGERGGSITLTDEQQAVYNGILAVREGEGAHAALLHGVTGSGKTSVYIELIRATLAEGKSAILLVPEIALTPQMVRSFCKYFGDEVAVIHSALTYAQRYDEYKRIQAGKARVVVGTRTAVFAPLQSLGLLIIDEEQEYTYRAESAPRYDAIEIAKYRCAKSGALLLLGSATPSATTYHSALGGALKLFTLDKRYNDMPLPEVVISDMRGALRDGDASLIGARLRDELRRTLDGGQQAVLFLNRRGSARMLTCIDCGYAPECENCSTALHYHARNGRLMCHHCGHSAPTPSICPVCGGEHLRLIGAGTQKIEEELYALFPDIRVLRMDADTTTGRTTHEALLERFEKGGADVLLGTQMISKGLDFDNVTLVGVLDADLSLNCGDYHAQERTFALLTQVAGRAGRRETRGRAVVQTYRPTHPIILAAAAQDYHAFYEYEIASREAIAAPPFCDLFVFQLSGISEAEAMRAAVETARLLEGALRRAAIDSPVLGPVPAAIARLNKRYRFMVSFRGRDRVETRRLVAEVLDGFHASPFARLTAVTAMMNPYSL